MIEISYRWNRAYFFMNLRINQNSSWLYIFIKKDKMHMYESFITMRKFLCNFSTISNYRFYWLYQDMNSANKKKSFQKTLLWDLKQTEKSKLSFFKHY